MLKREAEIRGIIAGLDGVLAFVDDLYRNTSAPIISYDIDRLDEQIQNAVCALWECIAHEPTDPRTKPLSTSPEPVKSGLDSSHMVHTNRSKA